MKNKKQKINTYRNFKFALTKIFKIEKIYIFELIYLLIVKAIATFTFPYILTIVINGIEQKNDIIDIIMRTIIIVFINLILNLSTEFIARDIHAYRKNKIGSRLYRDFYLETFDLDYEKFEDSNIQDSLELAGRVYGPSGGLIRMLELSFDTMGEALIFLISSAIIININVWLVLLIFVLAIIELLLRNYDRKKYKRDFHDKVPNIWRKITYANNISKNLSIGKDLRIYDMNKFIEKERSLEVKKYLHLFKKIQINSGIIRTIINLIKSIDEILLYGFMIYEVLNNNMSLALFTYMISAIRELIYALSSIVSNNSLVVQNSLQINDYIEFTKQDYVYRKGVNKVEKGLVEIEFQNVYYSYLEQEGFALEDVSFTIKKGEKISLVGFNGAGKTTLIKLLCGFYHPTKGKILINGIDIETIDRKSLLDIFAPVFQNSDMFAVSVLENVSMLHKDDTNEEKAMKALEKSGVLEKILSLKHQEKTIITKEYDEYGIELSGGENQKLAIARAIYKNAPFIMLDEPTSNLDSIAEATLYKNLNSIIGNSSAIFISHRLSSTRFCDRVILLEEGKIIECGTHDELMSKDTKYKEMFNMQAEYYVGGVN